MLLDCPTCSRCYQVDPAELGQGRMVICPRCQTRWHISDASRDPSESSRRSDLLRLTGVGDRSPSCAVEPVLERASRNRPRFGAASVFAVGLVGAALLLTAGREHVMRVVPGAVHLYAAVGLHVHPRGLEFTRTVAARRDAATSDVVITGEIRNSAKRRIAVPRLIYDVRDAAGASLVRWTESAQATNVTAGKVLAFASSPHHLPVESRTVLVRFETDGGSVGGSKGR